MTHFGWLGSSDVVQAKKVLKKLTGKREKIF